MKKRKILWIDNDKAYITPYILVIKEDMGIPLDIVSTVSSAESIIKSAMENEYSLLILDVMIPLKDEDIAAGYQEDSLGNGHNAGLLFYKRMKNILKQKKIPILVLTLRLDAKINQDFNSEGLPLNAFSTKLTLRDVSRFQAKIEEMLNEH